MGFNIETKNQLYSKSVSYLIIFLPLVFIFLSNPFFKIPYDAWDHILRIVSLHDTGKSFLCYPENTIYLYIWHLIWAKIFKILNINNIFVWIKIIHVTQFILAYTAIFYFSRTVIRILKADLDNTIVKYLSLFSCLVWFIGNGTFSVAYQQAWIMWYSLAHQGLSVPLFWYITALTIKLFHGEAIPVAKKRFFIAQVVFISLLIALIHPTELVYYFINLTLLCALDIRKIANAAKKNFAVFASVPLIAVLILVSLIIFAKTTGVIPLPALLNNADIMAAWKQVKFTGSLVAHKGFNRFPNSFSEIAIFALILGTIFKLNLIWNRKSFSINNKFYNFILLSSVTFFLIPMNKFLAGAASYITHVEVVYRFFFASCWFIFIPFISYIVLNYFMTNVNAAKVSILNAAVIICLVLASKYLFSGALYGNTKSILLSLDNRKVGIQYSAADIERLRVIIDHYEINNVADKPNIYYIRGDLAPIVRGVFRKYVYPDRPTKIPTDVFFKNVKNMVPMKTFFQRGLDKKYHLINVELPKDFPKDEETFKYFDLEKKYE